MISIDQVNVTVTVDGGSESGEAAFARLFNRAIDRWWREREARVRQELRSAEGRSVIGSREGGR